MLTRVVAVFLAVCLAPADVLSMDGDFSEPASLGLVLAIVAFGFLGVCFLASTWPFNARVEEVEPHPWMSNPFRSSLQFLHFSAVILFATGISALLVGLFRVPKSWAGELPLLFGVGLWIGVRYCSPKHPSGAAGSEGGVDRAAD